MPGVGVGPGLESLDGLKGDKTWEGTFLKAEVGGEGETGERTVDMIREMVSISKVGKIYLSWVSGPTCQ